MSRQKKKKITSTTSQPALSFLGEVNRMFPRTICLRIKNGNRNSEIAKNIRDDPGVKSRSRRRRQ